jgi:hypothetical protein
MAYHISVATGNSTAVGTYAAPETAANAFLDNESNNSVLSTTEASNRSATTFQSSATIDRVLVKIASRAASPSGTMTVQIWNATDGVAVTGTAVTINVSDIHVGDTTARGGCGWYALKLAAPVTLPAGKNLVVSPVTSASNQVNLYRDGTTANWSHILVTTTAPGSLAAADVFICVGAYTAAGSLTSYTVTNDNTSTTAWGQMHVGRGGTWSNGTAGSTAYYWKTTGDWVVSGGTVNWNTPGARLASSSSLTIFLNSASVAQYGVKILSGGTLNAGGANKLAWSRMTVDKAAAATTIVVGATTNWAANDSVVFPSTTRTLSQFEKKVIQTVDSSTQFTLAAGLTNAHSGTNDANGDIRCTVGNITRNVLITGASASNTGYVFVGPTATVDFRDVEFTSLGTFATDKWGIDTVTTSGNFNMDNCALHDFTVSTTEGVGLNTTALSGSWSCTNNVIYNTAYYGININQAMTGTWTVSGNLVVGISGTNGITCNDVGGTLTNNIVGSCFNGIVLSETGVLGTCTGNICHSATSTGVTLTCIDSTSGLSCTVWRNAVSGFHSGSSVGSHLLIISAFGNLNNGVQLVTANFSGTMVLTLTCNAGTTLTQPIGLAISSHPYNLIILKNCSFGATTTHATADVSIGSGACAYVYAKNCLFASATEVTGHTAMLDVPLNPAGVFSDDHDQVSGAFKSWMKYGVTLRDSSIQDSSKDTYRMTPASASGKLRQQYPFEFRVEAGTTPTISAKVRCSSAGDGATYNGNRPRLILMEDPCLGVNAPAVLATATSAANGAFETISAACPSLSRKGVIRVIVDCDGTAGWVNLATTPTYAG